MIRYILSSQILLLFILPFFAQEQTGEIRFSLNGKWAFKANPNNVGEEENWFAENYAASGWESMEVPRNWDTHNECAHFSGKSWYRKTVEIRLTDSLNTYNYDKRRFFRK